MSALLGRIPSAVGYQPTLSTEMGALQERITSTNKGSITSVQAIYVPADDLTDPAPATAFAHLDATTVLSRALTEIGIYPAVDPLDSTSTLLDPQRRRRSATTTSPARCRRSSRSTRTCRTSSPSSAWTSSARTTSSSSSRARKIQRFLSQPFFVASQFTGRRGQVRPAQGHDRRLRGDHRRASSTTLPEQAFYMVGNIDEAKAQGAEAHGQGLERRPWPTRSSSRS